MATVFENVNAAIFRELDRLEAAKDESSISAEIDRAQAVKELTNSAIDNVRAMTSAAKCMSDIGANVKVPHGLLEDTRGDY